MTDLLDIALEALNRIASSESKHPKGTAAAAIIRINGLLVNKAKEDTKPKPMGYPNGLF